MSKTYAPEIRHETIHDFSAMDDMIGRLQPKPIVIPYTPVWVKLLIGCLASTLAAAVLLLLFREHPAPTVVTQTGAPSPPAAVKDEVAKAGKSGKIVSNYVIFHNALWRGGKIETGWRFPDNNATEPSQQWCHYTYPGETSGTLRVIPLVDNNTLSAWLAVDLPSTALAEAESKCIWFGGRKPVG